MPMWGDLKTLGPFAHAVHPTHPGTRPECEPDTRDLGSPSTLDRGDEDQCGKQRASVKVYVSNNGIPSSACWPERWPP